MFSTHVFVTGWQCSRGLVESAGVGTPGTEGWLYSVSWAVLLGLSDLRSLSTSSLHTCFKTEVVSTGTLASPFIFGFPSFPSVLARRSFQPHLHWPCSCASFPMAQSPLSTIVLTTSAGTPPSCQVTSEQLVCSPVAGPSLALPSASWSPGLKESNILYGPSLLQVPIYFLLCHGLDISSRTSSATWMALPLCSVRNKWSYWFRAT